MDRPYHGDSTGLQTGPNETVLGGQSTRGLSSPTPARLQKKRSNIGLRDDAQALGTRPPYNGGERDSTGLGGGSKARKGSLRNAVRRIFGRRSREVEPQPTQLSPRHGQHRSEVIGPTSQMVSEPLQETDQGNVQRALSAPMPPPNSQRRRSPYAMQFPQSAKLKPLDLGNPFDAPGSQLRRRKTLPSMLISDSDAAALAVSIGPSRNSRGAGDGVYESFASHNVETSKTKTKQEKRRSRSADDLRRMRQDSAIPPRKRSEEIRQWRESFHDPVLRASGFKARSPVLAAADEERTPTLTADDPFDTSRPTVITPAFQRDMSVRDIGSSSAFGTEFSRDLEDRVARLEQGLQSFRGELALLSADRNRRTVLVGGGPGRQRAASGGRTASFLATDLQQDLRPSNYQYEYMDSMRPTTSPQYMESTRPITSPQPPRTPTATDPSAVTPNFSLPRAADDPFVSPSRAPTALPPTSNGAATSTGPQQYTFRSLYQIIADERSARRDLERQMNSLRTELANLSYQMSAQSNVQSQRSSYNAPMAGSSRLRALLGDVGASPQQSPEERFEAEQRVVSRFSGSESETVEAEEPQTPLEAYQTPLEQQGRFPLGGRRRSEGEMF